MTPRPMKPSMRRDIAENLVFWISQLGISACSSSEMLTHNVYTSITSIKDQLPAPKWGKIYVGESKPLISTVCGGWQSMDIY